MKTAITLIARLFGLAWLAFFSACASQQDTPDLNPSPKTHFTVVGTKSADVEAHFEFVYAADAEKCLIHRPDSPIGVVRIQRDERRSVAAGVTDFEIMFVLDRYLSGQCRWHPDMIRISVNRPPYNELSAGRTTIVSFKFVGTPGLARLELICSPEVPNRRALTCKGPVANFGNQPGKLHLAIIDVP